MGITHTFVSTNTNTQDSTFVRKEEWNADHTVDLHSYVGYNTIGGSTEQWSIRRVFLKQFTISSAGVLLSVGAYVKSRATGASPQFLTGVLTDNSGSPEFVIANSIGSIIVPELTGDNRQPRWIHLPLGIYLASGTYWMAYGSDNTSVDLYYDTSGSDKYYTPGVADIIADATFYTLNTSANRYSIRGDFLTTN